MEHSTSSTDGIIKVKSFDKLIREAVMFEWVEDVRIGLTVKKDMSSLEITVGKLEPVLIQQVDNAQDFDLTTFLRKKIQDAIL